VWIPGGRFMLGGGCTGQWRAVPGPTDRADVDRADTIRAGGGADNRSRTCGSRTSMSGGSGVEGAGRRDRVVPIGGAGQSGVVGWRAEPDGWVP